MSEWKTMDSAPKDGTPILVFDPPHKDARECGYQVLAYSTRDDEWFLCDNYDRSEWEISDGAHWMPLPAPPAALALTAGETDV